MILCFFISFFFTLALLPFSQSSITEADSWQKIGVLSQGNFDTIHHIAPNAIPVIADGLDSLYTMVSDGTVDVGLISGKPDPARYKTFPSGAISPRSMMTRKNETTTRRLIDAAIVRLQRSGKLSEYAKANSPFEYVEVHMCRSSEPDRHMPFPARNTFSPAVIRVGALGPYNWHQDGDYTVTPPTGFWPSFFTGLQTILVNHTLERRWYRTSSAVMDALLAGEVDVTEGYWTVDSFYQDNPRTWAFDAGCTTLGYESTFFMRLPETKTVDDKSDLTVWLSVVGVSLFVVLVVLLVMIFRERKGEPIFSQHPLLDNGKPSEVQPVDV